MSTPGTVVHCANCRDGFSLVEVALALGILTFALVALVGLLPAGLRSFESAIDATVQTQIAQTVATRARQAKFTELEKLNLRADSDETKPEADFFYDDQGREIPSTGGEVPPTWIYGAAVTVRKNASTVSTALPTGGTSSIENGNLATLRVVVTRISAPGVSRDFNLYVADNGL